MTAVKADRLTALLDPGEQVRGGFSAASGGPAEGGASSHQCSPRSGDVPRVLRPRGRWPPPGLSNPPVGSRVSLRCDSRETAQNQRAASSALT